MCESKGAPHQGTPFDASIVRVDAEGGVEKLLQATLPRNFYCLVNPGTSLLEPTNLNEYVGLVDEASHQTIHMTQLSTDALLFGKQGECVIKLITRFEDQCLMPKASL